MSQAKLRRFCCPADNGRFQKKDGRRRSSLAKTALELSISIVSCTSIKNNKKKKR